MVISKFNDLSDFTSYMNSKIETHFLPLDVHADPDLLLTIHECDMDSSSYSSYYKGNKTDLKNNVFNDLLPSLRDSLLQALITRMYTLHSHYLVPNIISYYDIYNDLENDDVDYSNYFSDIKSVISKLANDNKFYRKNIVDLNVEIVELRKQNADLQQQLQIKSISTWG